MNYYLYYTESHKGIEAPNEDIAQVKTHAKYAYDGALRILHENNAKTQVDRLIDKHGKDAVLNSGFMYNPYKKPVVVKYINIDCFGDNYSVPTVRYADGKYDYRGLSEESLKAYIQGYDYGSVGCAAGGTILLISEALTMEGIAEKLVDEPRTYTIRSLPKNKRLIDGPVSQSSLQQTDTGIGEKSETKNQNDGSRIYVSGEGVFDSNIIMNEIDGKWVEQVEKGRGVKILSYALIIKVASIQAKYAGGWLRFAQFCQAHKYPLVTDAQLVATYDGDVTMLEGLISSLIDSGLQCKRAPVDYYIADPVGVSMIYNLSKKSDPLIIFRGDQAIGTRNDYEIEIFIDNHIKARLRESNWHKHRYLYRKAMRLFEKGDMIGSEFETGAVGYSPIGYAKIMERCKRGGLPTDETDIVKCFDSFIRDYRDKGIVNLLLDWVVYHSKHRAHAKYGRTYMEHFQTVGTLKAKETLTLERLYELSKDKNSFGNACLALVYPVYHLSDRMNLGRDDRHLLIEGVCKLTHAHSQAIGAVTLLFAVIDIAISGGNIFDMEEYKDYKKYLPEELRGSVAAFLTADIDLHPEDFVKKHPNNVIALNTLFYALYAVKQAGTIREVVTNVISLHGDADSVAASAMMIWGLAHP